MDSPALSNADELICMYSSGSVPLLTGKSTYAMTCISYVKVDR